MNKRFSAFLVCLVVAALFWFLNALSKNYNAAIILPVVYQNLPNNKILTRKLPETISIELNAQGFLILAYQYKFINDSILIDAGNLNIRAVEDHYEARMTTASKLYRIARQFSPEVKINRISPDTIYFAFGNKKRKEIPVKLNYSISYEKQYRLRDRIIFTPSTISISGLDKTVDAIEFFDTDSLVLKEVNNTITTELPLKVPEQYSTLQVSAKSVHVTVPVEKYTEASVEVPIEVINLPQDRGMKIFPEKVQITYIVGFSDFDRVSEQMFAARVDYLKRDNGNRLSVEITRHPDFVKILKQDPSKVEYLIRKK